MFGARASSYAAAGGGFTPEDIAGLLVWLDATDAGTITDAGSGAVSAWADKSPSGLSFTQATSTARPTTGVRTLNGLNVLDFDGGDTLISATSVDTSTTDQHTTFVVVVMDVLTDTRAIVEFGPSTFGTSNRGGLLYWESNEFRMFQKRDGFTQIAVVTGAGSTGGYVVTGTATAASSGTSRTQVYRNKTSTTSYAFNDSIAAGDMVSAAMHLGSRNGSALFLNGAIGEVITYNSVLDTTDRETVIDYLNVKWGL